MEKFMLLIREDLKRLKRFSNEEHITELDEMYEWAKPIAESGRLVSTEPVEPTGRYVRKMEVLSDGPFIESEEGVAGYYVIFAKDIGEAVLIAHGCPLVKGKRQRFGVALIGKRNQ
jgi:hypothetical protein